MIFRSSNVHGLLTLYLAAATIALGFGSSAGYAAALTPVPGSRIAFDVDVSVFEPISSHGAILKVAADLTKSPELRAFDMRGNLISAIPIQIPGAETVRIYAATRGADGSFAVSGYSLDGDGRVATFIYLVSPAGLNPSTLIRTAPSAPRSLAIAADGTIWATGNVYHRSDAPADVDPAGGILRHYAASGKLLDSTYPQTDSDNKSRTVTGVLAASRDRVGWLSSGFYKKGIGWPGAYIEINSAGERAQYPLPALRQSEGRAIVALAITDANDVFATGYDVSEHVRVFHLDRTSKTWNVIALPGFPDTEPFLLGADKNVVAVWDSSNHQVQFFDTDGGK